MTTTARTRGALLAAGAAVTAALLAPGLASADPAPSNPLLDSTCSFAQIDAALQQTAPKLAARLDKHPRAEAALTDLFNRPADQRQQAIDQFRAEHPKLAARLDAARTGPHADRIHAELATVADTCHDH
ncbi:hypothetical protein GCM10023094_50420 [Rhodococcus olei]|uniref:Haemophore haem-binding domain-containing protein n=1 Tax=Rhodococcus olei TaxID=2161675 RepID=A0ABP8PMX4_9NOCA